MCHLGQLNMATLLLGGGGGGATQVHLPEARMGGVARETSSAAGDKPWPGLLPGVPSSLSTPMPLVRIRRAEDSWGGPALHRLLEVQHQARGPRDSTVQDKARQPLGARHLILLLPPLHMGSSRRLLWASFLVCKMRSLYLHH